MEGYTKGYTCSCDEEYELAADKRTCKLSKKLYCIPIILDHIT